MRAMALSSGGSFWPAAQAEREGEVAGADEERVDAGGGGDGVDFVEGGRLFDHADGEDVLVGGIVVVAGLRPGADGGAGAGASFAGGRIAAGGGRAGGLLGGTGKREDDAAHALIEDALGGPQLHHGDAGEDGGGARVGGQHDEAKRLQRDGGVLHLDPQKVEAEGGGVGGGFHRWDGDGDAEGGLAGGESRAHGIAPGLLIGHVFRFWRITAGVRQRRASTTRGGGVENDGDGAVGEQADSGLAGHLDGIVHGVVIEAGSLGQGLYDSTFDGEREGMNVEIRRQAALLGESLERRARDLRKAGVCYRFLWGAGRLRAARQPQTMWLLHRLKEDR